MVLARVERILTSMNQFGKSAREAVSKHLLKEVYEKIREEAEAANGD